MGKKRRKHVRREAADIRKFSADAGDSDRECIQWICVSLEGRDKHITIFDFDVGLTFPLNDKDAREIIETGFLNVTFKPYFRREKEGPFIALEDVEGTPAERTFSKGHRP